MERKFNRSNLEDLMRIAIYRTSASERSLASIRQLLQVLQADVVIDRVKVITARITENSSINYFGLTQEPNNQEDCDDKETEIICEYCDKEFSVSEHLLTHNLNSTIKPLLSVFIRSFGQKNDSIFKDFS